MKNIKTLNCFTIFIIVLLNSNVIYAEEPTQELEGISVIGNRELPQALVIVPWQPPQPGEFDGKPLQSLIDEVLGPIDKDVHKRKVSYYEQYR